jgi:hypothetical protein
MIPSLRQPSRNGAQRPRSVLIIAVSSPHQEVLMITRTGTALVAVAAAACSLAAVAPSASARVTAPAGSFVYSKGGNIHLAHADGSHDIVFKTGGWYWPSMSNGGVIAAERQDRAAPDGTTGYTIHRFKQNGTQLSRQNTPSSLSTIACPSYPSYHLSLSPDGTKVAYDYIDCNGIFATWTPSTRFHLHTQVDYFAPAWLSNSALTISHHGVTVTSDQAEVATWTTTGSGTGRSTDLADSWATAYHATSTRDGKKIALIEDDAADYFDGVPRTVKLVFGTSTGPMDAITRQCAISLPATQYSNWGGATYTNLTFRSDGKVLAFDSQAGIYKVNTSNLAGCTATTLNKQLWIKGGINPSFSPATDTRG